MRPPRSPFIPFRLTLLRIDISVSYRKSPTPSPKPKSRRLSWTPWGNCGGNRLNWTRRSTRRALASDTWITLASHMKRGPWTKTTRLASCASATSFVGTLPTGTCPFFRHHPFLLSRSCSQRTRLLRRLHEGMDRPPRRQSVPRLPRAHPPGPTAAVLARQPERPRTSPGPREAPRQQRGCAAIAARDPVQFRQSTNDARRTVDGDVRQLRKQDRDVGTAPALHRDDGPWGEEHCLLGVGGFVVEWVSFPWGLGSLADARETVIEHALRANGAFAR